MNWICRLFGHIPHEEHEDIDTRWRSWYCLRCGLFITIIDQEFPRSNRKRLPIKHLNERKI